jgi:hypothetical protein
MSVNLYSSPTAGNPGHMLAHIMLTIAAAIPHWDFSVTPL